jgi:hypothetical protein
MAKWRFACDSFVRKVEERDRLGDARVDVRMVLKLSLRMYE